MSEFRKALDGFNDKSCIIGNITAQEIKAEFDTLKERVRELEEESKIMTGIDCWLDEEARRLQFSLEWSKTIDWVATFYIRRDEVFVQEQEYCVMDAVKNAFEKAKVKYEALQGKAKPCPKQKD